ncbi:tRNA (adenosine(37)-N6)-dimethylallyltransferase MiaA [Anaerovibrio lipolyticus]|uniref:tRNA (adenosine(37)-N6)-dimethylallyltransferase MiaA n=1 Tax=Anaerovibrio lipolyticus TaxID=82374 RepID=UPI000EEE0C15|nr:tRNA (adenosine(37)-N6)-dimethylallyltransferase MiaA [Anaerovibrio lipolyticus]MBE6105621.1 tRNA (adenosine(37)-N6)-dimethylallyltransferase MiaA [Anaerovibrio lipolyticus]HCP95821.1 tRNA (adenosine(37)-N6)-dimethylallyltransferase MiaA [Anaerovibrio sp.]
MQRERLIVVLGPTASGKTELSIELAKQFDTEIISGDSQLVYKGFDIGSAKPDMKERDGVVHHMIDILPPEASFNVADFVDRVKPIITALNNRGKVPILAGGTGLYIKSLLEGYKFNDTAGDDEYRLKLEKLVEEKGKQYLHDMLREINPEAAERIHVNNFRRVMRALEVYHLGGEQISTQKESSLVYDVYVAGLIWHRSELYDRINRRVHMMLQQGLAEEVRNLLNSGVSPESQSMRGIGYKEMVNYVQGTGTLEQAVDDIKKGTRHFAKRQLTWYRKMPYVHWYHPSLYRGRGLADNVSWNIARFFKG